MRDVFTPARVEVVVTDGGRLVRRVHAFGHLGQHLVAAGQRRGILRTRLLPVWRM